MKIEFDPEKRNKTLLERGLDFQRASEIFDGVHYTFDDDRFSYAEARHITIGRLDGRMVVMVWTLRFKARRIISLRKANEREQKIYGERLG